MNFPKDDLAVALATAVDKLPFEVSAEKQEKLLQFLEQLHKWNKAYNLTSVRYPNKMLYVHIVDSIAVAPELSESNYIDVGTGPGLPGIPLAILFPEKQFVLLDSLGKRIRFIKQVAFELKLSNITPVQSRVEDYQPEHKIDGVVTRAFASIKDMLHWCQHLVDSSGTFVALKGQFPEEELQELPEGFSVAHTKALNVPGLDAERHIIKIKKS